MNDCLYCAENESAIESLRALLARCEAAEAERDAARAEAARLKKELAAKIPGQVVQSIRDDRDRLRAEAARLREAIQAALDSPNHMGSEDIDILLAALDREGR